MRISSELVEISSEPVRISSEQVRISSEQVSTIGELLIISAFKISTNRVLADGVRPGMHAETNFEFSHLLFFMLKTGMSLTSAEQMPSPADCSASKGEIPTYNSIEVFLHLNTCFPYENPTGGRHS
jgi:hypothetical protein